MRFQYRAAGPIAAALLVALLAGCSRTQQDWRAAQQAGTARAYQAFAARHPDSELAGVARQRIAQLTEAAAWRQATRDNTAAAYQAYLAQYPQGSWSQDARIRMESRSLAPMPAPMAMPAAPAATTASAAAAPGSHAAPAGDGPTGAASAPPSASEWRYAVQLGAYSNAANAVAAWTRLASKLRPLLQGRTHRVVPASVSGRQLFRLEVSVADATAARRLCRQLQQHSQGCLPLPQATGVRHNLTNHVTTSEATDRA
jgi:SPOR domain